MDIDKLKFPIGTFIQPKNYSNLDITNKISEIEKFPIQIKSLTETLTIRQLQWIYRPNGWSILQVVHHCADSHMNSFIRFKLALTENIPTIKPYEEAKWATLIDGLDTNLSASIKIIEGIHYRWVLLLKSLNNEQLKKQFRHPETKNTYTLEEAIGLYAWHCNHHLAHIKQAIVHKGQFKTENYE
jgi:hypothetical protein